MRAGQRIFVASARAQRAGESEAEQPAFEIAAKLLLDRARHGPLGVAAEPSFSLTNQRSCSSPRCAVPRLHTGRRRSSRATIATIDPPRYPRSRSLHNVVASALCSTGSGPTGARPSDCWSSILPGSRSSGFRPTRRISIRPSTSGAIRGTAASPTSFPTIFFILAGPSPTPSERPGASGDCFARRDDFGLGEVARSSLYDAAYLEVAQRLGLPLLTLDDRLRRAAREAGVEILGPQQD